MSKQSNNLSLRPTALIVGAGAVGLILGYHLSLSGVNVTFLVRRGKKAIFPLFQQLYCYDDVSLKTFSDYNVVDDIEEVVKASFQFVIVTLDGYTSRTDEGAMLLRSLGYAIRKSDAIVVMAGGFGIGLREYFIQTMGISDNRILTGFATILSHQAHADLPIHPPTDPVKIAMASICYKHPADKIGFRLGTHNPKAAKEFAELYNNSGVSRCVLMGAKLIEAVSNAGFPLYAACQIAKWPKELSTVVRNKELWRLSCRAQGEILSLPKNGWLGKLLSLMMGSWVTAKIHLKMERDMQPLDYQGFNRFHHGGKVHAQDVKALRDCLEEGQRQGSPMTALKELLRQLDDIEQ